VVSSLFSFAARRRGTAGGARSQRGPHDGLTLGAVLRPRVGAATSTASQVD
jgi:hypothetical protein